MITVSQKFDSVLVFLQIPPNKFTYHATPFKIDIIEMNID